MKHQRTIIGVMGASKVSQKVKKDSERLGTLLADEGFVVLTGGEPSGVMEHALKGAVEAGGETVGILPRDKKSKYSKYITIPIFTDSGIGRDYFNVLSSNVLIVCSPISSGTLIEVAYALKKEVPMVLLNVSQEDKRFIKKRGVGKVYIANNLQDAVKKAKEWSSN